MEGSQIAIVALRVFGLLCACVVLGTSVDLSKFFTSDRVQEICKLAQSSTKCHLGGITPAVEYGAFVGVWGLIDSLLGLVSAFLTAIPWVAVAAVDGLAALFYFAGAIRIAVWLSDFSGHGSKWTELQADDAFMWLGFLVTLVLIALVLLWQRRAIK